MERAGRLIGKLKIPKGVVEPEALAKKAWPIAVGVKIARHTLALALVRATLVVEVEDAVWQRQLYSLRNQILKNVQEAMGNKDVQEIEFRPMLRKREAHRADAARSASGDEADGIQDPVLERFYRASRRNAAS